MSEDMNNVEELRDEIVENEEITEAQDAVDVGSDEKASIDSVAKAANATSKTSLPATKGKMIAAMYDRMSKMNKEALTAAYTKMMEGVELSDEEISEDVDHSAELDAAMADEATLSEEFKEKTSLIFEAAIRSKLAEEVSRMEESYKQELAEEIAATKESMVDKIDSYLNYVVESWMEDNKLAIETGIRTEIAENFMSKLKDVFVESYIEVPESKVDLVDDLAEANAELEEKLNTAVADSMALAEQVKDLKRESIIAEASTDLAQTQAEKLNTLVEGVAFDDEESFAKKVATIKESFFGAKEVAEDTADLTESVETEGEAEEAEVSGQMAHYLKYLKK